MAAWHQATKHPEAAPFYATDSQLGALPPTLMIVRALVCLRAIPLAAELASSRRMGEAHIDFLACGLAGFAPRLVIGLEKLYVGPFLAPWALCMTEAPGLPVVA